MSTDTYEGQRCQIPLEWELQAVMSHLTWVLGIDPTHSGKASLQSLNASILIKLKLNGHVCVVAKAHTARQLVENASVITALAVCFIIFRCLLGRFLLQTWYV